MRASEGSLIRACGRKGVDTNSVHGGESRLAGLGKLQSGHEGRRRFVLMGAAVGVGSWTRGSVRGAY